MEVIKSLSVAFSDQSLQCSQLVLQSLCISSKYLLIYIYYLGNQLPKEKRCTKTAIIFTVIHMEAHNFLYMGGRGRLKPIAPEWP